MLLTIDYYLLALPAIFLAAWAQWKIVTVMRRAGRVPASSGMTGAEAALRTLEVSAVAPVDVEPVTGQLATHYDSAHHVLRLLPEVHAGRSLAAIGAAGHEAGHVLQKPLWFPVLWVRAAIVPLAILGSTTFWMLISAGFLLGIFRLIVWGIIVLWGSLILQLINLPIERDASRRARQALVLARVVTDDEDRDIARVLNVSTWTHVAAILTGFPVWIYSLFTTARPRPPAVSQMINGGDQP
jgi:Zn-dependent membrane protease YugP